MLRVVLCCCAVGHAPPSGAPQPRVHLSRVSLSHTPARRAGQTVISFKAMGNSTSRVLGSPAEPNAPEGSAPAEEQPVVTVCSTSIDSNAPTNALSPSGEKEQAIPPFQSRGKSNVKVQASTTWPSTLSHRERSTVPTNSNRLPLTRRRTPAHSAMRKRSGLLEPTCAGIGCHADIALRGVSGVGRTRALSAGGAGPLDASVCVECANNELTTEHGTRHASHRRKSARVHKSRQDTRESAS